MNLLQTNLLTLKSLGLIIAATLLGGCLSSGGSSSGGSSSAPTPTEITPEEPADPSLAVTALGTFQGTVENGMRIFKGIRYGDAERFSSPTMAQAIEGTQILKGFGRACAQPDTSFGSASNNEDCLFLNVYAPEAPGNYPVMLWIHGGALLGGDGGADYPAERLVERGVVLVTINYRLGALGFLPHTELGDSNFGFQDQQLAMQWVQDNISAFGGNPDVVTIFGESAGGHSVLSHLASPTAANLFHRAIVQSGSYNGNQIPLKLDPASLNGIPPELAFDAETRIGDPIAQRIRQLAPDACGDDVPLRECLQAAPLQAILDGQSQILSERQIESILPAWDPDSPLLPRSINAALSSGHFNQVPVLMGSNLDEGDLFMLISTATGWTFGLPGSYQPQIASLLREDSSLDTARIADDYLQRARDLIAASPIIQAELAEREPVISLVYPYVYAYSLIVTDWRFNCPNARQWTLLNDQVDTFGYWFSDRDSLNIYRAIRAMDGISIPDDFPLGASHAFELPYLFSDQATFTVAGATEEQQGLSVQMLDYWTNFAKFGDPNATDGSTESVNWPRYVESAGQVLRLETPAPQAVTIDAFRTQHNCTYWDNPPRLGGDL